MKLCGNFILTYNSPIYNDVASVLKIHESDKSDKIIDKWRFQVNGIIYHSLDYPKKKSSCSHYCRLHDGSFCLITSLLNENILVHQYMNTTSIVTALFNMTIDIDDGDFCCFDPNQYICRQVSLTDIKNRCLYFTFQFRGEILFVLSSLLE